MNPRAEHALRLVRRLDEIERAGSPPSAGAEVEWIEHQLARVFAEPATNAAPRRVDPSTASER